VQPMSSALASQVRVFSPVYIEQGVEENTGAARRAGRGVDSCAAPVTGAAWDRFAFTVYGLCDERAPRFKFQFRLFATSHIYGPNLPY